MNVLIAAHSAKRRFQMKNFTIENETNNIIVHANIQDAEAVANAERFRTEAQLARLAADWPAARLVEIWNSLPGQTPLKKFKDRATAVSRIWKAIQRLTGAEALVDAGSDFEAPSVVDQISTDETPQSIAEGAADQSSTEEALHSEAEVVVPEPEEPTVIADVAPQTPDAAPAEAPAKNKANRTKKAPKEGNAGEPREGSKTSQVIAMLKREGGTTLEEIMTAMGWQKHTTRAMLSAGGSLTKNHGLTVISEKIGEKRVYSIKA
jgi:hypothetical protein